MIKNKVDICKSINQFLVCNIVIVLATIIMTLVMTAIYALPVSKTKESIKKSYSLYSNQIIDNWAGDSDALYASLSNFADSIMLNHAITRPYQTTIKNALLNPKTVFVKNTSMVNNLTLLLDENEGEVMYENYARYWNGYLVYLIPLLQFFSVGEIKAILLFIQFILFTIVVVKLASFDIRYSIAFAGAALFINPITTALTFQEADIYIIALFFYDDYIVF